MARRRTSEWPLRLRLVAGFCLATFGVLLAAGAFIYWRFDVALNRDLDMELAKSARSLSPLVNADGRITERIVAAAPGVAWQVLDQENRVLDSDGPATREPLLSEEQFEKVQEGSITFNVGAFLPASHEPYRVRVVPAPAHPGYHLLIATRRDQRDKSLRDLVGQLLLAGMGALAVIAFVGDRLTRAALRPVEEYRRRAQQIADGDAELRLEVPEQRDDEITRLGHTFNDMLASLDRSLTRERQFVSEASHELRTPITLLTSRVQLAMRRPRSQLEHERILAELRIDLDRLAALANQLLDRGSRADLGNDSVREETPEDPGPTDLVEVAARLGADRAALIEPVDSGDGSLVLDLAEQRILVSMREVELERVLTNLLDNATVHGAPPVVLSIDRPAPGWARIMVSDNGPGMSPDLLETATRHFARSETARNRPGAGLGLALVHSLVLDSAGQLRLCHGGRHVRHGSGPGIACGHGLAMTVTVLVPCLSRPEESE